MPRRATRLAPRALAISIARSSAATSPEITVWPGQLSLATMMTPPLDAS